MIYTVVIILVVLALAVSAAALLLKLRGRQPFADGDTGDQRELQASPSGHSAAPRQPIAADTVPEPPPGLGVGATLPIAACPPSSEAEGCTATLGKAEPQPASPNTLVAPGESDGGEFPDPPAEQYDPTEPGLARPAELNTPDPEHETAIVGPGEAIGSADQDSATDAVQPPTVKEAPPVLIQVSEPIAMAAGGALPVTSDPAGTALTVDRDAVAGAVPSPKVQAEMVTTAPSIGADGGNALPQPVSAREPCDGAVPLQAPSQEQVRSGVTTDTGSASEIGQELVCAAGLGMGETHQEDGRETEYSPAAVADVSTQTAATPPPDAALQIAEGGNGESPGDTRAETVGLMEPQAPKDVPAPETSEEPRTPRMYRPSPRTPLQGRNPRQTNGASTTSRNRAMRIEVRVLFERGGFCRVSLLAQRDDSLPAEIEVTGAGDPPALLALQDEWFQDVSFDAIGDVLEHGLVWQGKVKGIGAVRWNLSGREIFVLGRRNDLSGYITIPRLLLGEDHVVICTEGRLQSVLEALRTAGSPDPAMLRADLGAPRGWVVLRGVTPKSPVANSSEGDILDALRPLANVEIVLLDGIRLTRTTWLVGYPPRIHLQGNANNEVEDVRIDGRPALRGADGNYEVEAWDSLGTHEVWCPSASRSYTIEEGPEHWDAWDAYDWSLGEPTSIRATVPAAICGMLVCPHDERAKGRNAVTIPTTNCVIIGSNPGEIYVCRARTELRLSTQVAFPWFAPTWALPLDPLHCDKRVTRVRLIGGVEGAAPSTSLAGRGRTQAVMAWCSAILDAGRKGLAVDPAEDATQKLWREYRQVARSIRRGHR